MVELSCFTGVGKEGCGTNNLIIHKLSVSYPPEGEDFVHVHLYAKRY